MMRIDFDRQEMHSISCSQSQGVLKIMKEVTEMSMKERLQMHREIVREQERKIKEWKPQTVSDAVKGFHGESYISIETKEYGQFWLGKAKYAFSHIAYESRSKRAETIGHRIIIC